MNMDWFSKVRMVARGKFWIRLWSLAQLTASTNCPHISSHSLFSRMKIPVDPFSQDWECVRCSWHWHIFMMSHHLRGGIIGQQKYPRWHLWSPPFPPFNSHFSLYLSSFREASKYTHLKINMEAKKNEGLVQMDFSFSNRWTISDFQPLSRFESMNPNGPICRGWTWFSVTWSLRISS